MTKQKYTRDYLFGLNNDQRNTRVVSIPYDFITVCDNNFQTAVMLSQIVFWFGTSKRTGKTRITPDKNGERWLAKPAKDWEQECHVKEGTARRAINWLKEKGFIRTKIKKWAGVPTTFIQLNEDALLFALSQLDQLDQIETNNRSSGIDQSAQMELINPVNSYIQRLHTKNTNTQQDPPPHPVCVENFEEEEKVDQSETIPVKELPPEKPRKRDKDKTQSLATQSDLDPDQYSAVEEKIKALGIHPGAVRRLIKKYWHNVEAAIAAVKERLEQGGVRNPIGLLKTAIAEGWKPIKQVVGSAASSVAAMTRQQWWDWVKEQKGLEWRKNVIVRVTELNGEDVVFLKSGEQMRLSLAKTMDLDRLFELGCSF